MPTLGIVGTMVWDTIRRHDAEDEPPVEAWGGIAYSLAAADAALDDGWTIHPILKVGRDLASEVDAFLDGLSRVADLSGVEVVDEPNNRVHLFYHDPSRRCEKLTGGVPGWTASEIGPLLGRCDALYVNFIAGWELDLEAAESLRGRVDGPLYADLHSLLLAVEDDGARTLQPLPERDRWLACFDAVQMNEDELAIVTGTDVESDPLAACAELLGPPPAVVFATLGEHGTTWLATDAAGARSSGSAPAPRRVVDGDPTGCGDVWGATCAARQASGDALADAAKAASAAASENAAFRGADGLSDHLRTARAARAPSVATGGTT